MTRFLDALASKSFYEFVTQQSRGIHLIGCNYGRYRPAYGDNGFVYDVAIPEPCDCYVSQPVPESHYERIKILQKFHSLHERLCAINFPEPSTYRGKPCMMMRNCTCWMSFDKAEDKV